MNERGIRRVAGYVLARLPDARFDVVADPRSGPKKWKLQQLLTAVVVGLMAGCRSLAELESLSGLLSPAMRRKLGIPRRLPDTTVRDALCAVGLDELRASLRRLVRAAWRRKALQPQGLPFGVVTLDGKVTALPTWDDKFVQRHQPEGELPYGLARTVTCNLVSAAGRPCLDAIPIPASTNEMGHFKAAFDSVNANYGALFRVVTYDAGALSEENARHVVESGKDYLLRLKGEQRTMFKLAEELLDPYEVVGETVDVLDNHTTVTRRLVLLTVQQNWAYGDGKSPVESVWQHARTFVRVESTTTKDGVVTAREGRMYVTSLKEADLTPAQWLLLIRSHWGVECNHNILDTAFAEDDRPWIVADPNGMLAVALLRRIGYTMLALFRSVSLRSEEKRHMRWRDLLSWVWTTLVAATDAHLDQLRLRRAIVVCD